MSKPSLKQMQRREDRLLDRLEAIREEVLLEGHAIGTAPDGEPGRLRRLLEDEARLERKLSLLHSTMRRRFEEGQR